MFSTRIIFTLTYLINVSVFVLSETPWPESASELYPPSDRRLSAKLGPTFADRGCHVVSVTGPCVFVLLMQMLLRAIEMYLFFVFFLA
jgi:hypothetical protein